jgi:hypothetical protein
MPLAKTTASRATEVALRARNVKEESPAVILTIPTAATMTDDLRRAVRHHPPTSRRLPRAGTNDVARISRRQTPSRFWPSPRLPLSFWRGRTVFATTLCRPLAVVSRLTSGSWKLRTRPSRTISWPCLAGAGRPSTTRFALRCPRSSPGSSDGRSRERKALSVSSTNALCEDVRCCAWCTASTRRSSR